MLASDGSFVILTSDVGGCGELRVVGGAGASVSDAETVIAASTCENPDNGFVPKVTTTTTPPGYTKVQPPNAATRTIIGHVIGGNSPLQPGERPVHEHFTYTSYQVADLNAWNETFPAPVIAQRKVGSRQVSVRDLNVSEGPIFAASNPRRPVGLDLDRNRRHVRNCRRSERVRSALHGVR